MQDSIPGNKSRAVVSAGQDGGGGIRGIGSRELLDLGGF